MRTVKLDEIADVKLGRQRSPQNHSGESMRPYLRAANVGWSGLRLDDVKQMNFTESEMEVFRLLPGDILLGEGSGSAAEVGKPALWAGELPDCAFQNTLLRVRPTSVADGRYLLHYFRWQASTGAFARGSRGVGIYHLGREALAAWPIPLPSSREQRRIAAILDQADALRAERRRLLDHLDEFAAAAFSSVFVGKPYPEEPLGALWVDQQIGLSRGATEQGPDRSFEYVKMNAITRDGSLDFAGLTRVDATPQEVERYSVADGDLLFNTRNSRELVGKTAVYRGHPRLYNNNIMRIRFGGRVVADYVHRYLWSLDGRRQLEARKVGTTSVYAIYAKTLATIQVPVPPLHAQHEFASRLVQINSQTSRIHRALTLNDELFASLQARAFRGEL